MGDETHVKTLRKVLYALLFGCFVTELIAGVWVHLSYSSNLPTTPNESSGHIYRMVVNHGFVVYGSDVQFRAYRWVENLQPFAIVCFLVALIVGLRYGDFKWAPGRKPNE